jgi:hypothetical protein
MLHATKEEGAERMTNNDTYIKSGWHWSFGWLRRPEMDESIGYCYEDGEGDLIYSTRPDHKLVCYLDCFQDQVSGEKYLTMNQEKIGFIVATKKNFLKNG